MTACAERRGFLRGLVSLPLLGGGVTLIGTPAVPVPLADAIGAPMLADPRQRVRYAWAALSAAMRETIPRDADGWMVNGGERDPLPARGITGGPWVRFEATHYLHEPKPRCPNLWVDRFKEIEL